MTPVCEALLLLVLVLSVCCVLVGSVPVGAVRKCGSGDELRKIESARCALFYDCNRSTRVLHGRRDAVGVLRGRSQTLRLCSAAKSNCNMALHAG